MGGLCEDYVFLLQGSAPVPLRCLPVCTHTCLYVSAPAHLYMQWGPGMSLTASPLQPAILPPCAVHFIQQSDFMSMLFPWNVQSCFHIERVLSKMISLSRVETRFNSWQITGLLLSFQFSRVDNFWVSQIVFHFTTQYFNSLGHFLCPNHNLFILLTRCDVNECISPFVILPWWKVQQNVSYSPDLMHVCHL